MPNTSHDGDVSNQHHDLSTKVIYRTEGKEAVTSLEDIRLFAEFPTPALLRDANRKYARLGKPIEYDSEGVVEPYPVASSKQSVFNLDEHQDLDLHAVQAPHTLLHKTLRELVSHLVEPAKSDVEKARVLFCWLTTQNLANIDASKAANDTVLYFLKRLKSGQLDYNSFYLEMCQLAELTCCQVEGYVKGGNYKPGDKPDDNHYGRWCAVLLDNVWRFVDAFWGSCHATGGGEEEWVLIDDRGTKPKPTQKLPTKQPRGTGGRAYERDEFYFLPNPEEFIYTHLPRNEKWQLLVRPVTVEEFREMAFLKPPFFEQELKVLNHGRCIKYACDGEIEIQVGLPEEKRRFLYRLWMSTAGDDYQSSTLGEVGLDRFVIMQYDENFLSCRIVFPIAGKFKLELFSRADTHDDCNTYKMVCNYIIICEDPKQNCKPLPENTRADWGPGLDMKAAGLRPITHKKGLVECEDGSVEMRFKEDRDVEILAKLTSSSFSRESLQKYTVNHKEGDEIVLNVQVPEGGEYALNLYAKDSNEEDFYSSICTYLLTSETAVFVREPFPSQTLGPTAKNKILGVELVSPPAPLIEVNESGEAEIVLRASTPTSFMSSLVYQSREEDVNMDDMCFRTTEGNRTIFRIRCPEAGTYAFLVYGKKRGDQMNHFPCVYQFLLMVSKPKNNCMPFPKTSPIWGDGCKLLEPESGLLSAGQTFPVAVQIPDAKNVAVIAGGKWFHLGKTADGVWRGEMESRVKGEVTLSAKTGENTLSYDTFAVFQVEEERAFEANRRKQEEAREKAQERATQRIEREREREESVKISSKELQTAMANCDIDGLRRALNTVEQKRFLTSMPQLVIQSRAHLQSFQRIEKLRSTILNMDSGTVLEIGHYTSPPLLIHEVMVAALLLLGDHEGLTRDWTECQKLCNTLGATGIKKRVRDFKVERLHPEIAARAKQILQRWRVDDVKATSAGAGIFYLWTIGTVSELHAMQKNSEKALPADEARQMEILSSKHEHKGTVASRCSIFGVMGWAIIVLLIGILLVQYRHILN